MTLPAFAHWLPYWTWRTIKCGGVDIAILVLVDGTLVTAFESSGADVFSADNARLNRNAATIRRALNALPADAFLQCEWHTGLSNDDLISRFAGRGSHAKHRPHAVLVEQRRVRARALRADVSLARGRLVYFVGQSRALGLLAGHRESAFMRLVGRGRDPQTITPKDFEHAAQRLAEVATRVRAELAVVGATFRPLDGASLLHEVNRALNPATSSSFRLAPVDRPEELPEIFTRAAPHLVHRPLTLREQLPLGT